jgi:hypothetical protein
MSIFEKMSKKEAIAYCYKHEKQFCKDMEKVQFDYLIELLKTDVVRPSQLPDYSMDFEKIELKKKLIGLLNGNPDATSDPYATVDVLFKYKDNDTEIKSTISTDEYRFELARQLILDKNPELEDKIDELIDLSQHAYSAR